MTPGENEQLSRLVLQAFEGLPGCWRVKIQPQTPPLGCSNVWDVRVWAPGGTRVSGTSWDPQEEPKESMVRRLYHLAGVLLGEGFGRSALDRRPA